MHQQERPYFQLQKTLISQDFLAEALWHLTHYSEQDGPYSEYPSPDMSASMYNVPEP